MQKSRSFFIFTFLFGLIFLGLGTWQLLRKAEKEAILEALAESQLQPPQNIDALKKPELFEPVYAEGYFVPGKTIFLQAKVFQGKNGVYVLDLFKTKKGKFLLIQRGWASTKISAPPSGLVKIEGVLRIPSSPTYFQPKNQKPTYFWIDLKTLSHDLTVPLLSYYVVAKTSPDPRIFPTPPLPSLSNHHLQYAITWFSLAFFLFFVLLWGRKIYWEKEAL